MRALMARRSGTTSGSGVGRDATALLLSLESESVVHFVSRSHQRPLGPAREVDGGLAQNADPLIAVFELGERDVHFVRIARERDRLAALGRDFHPIRVVLRFPLHGQRLEVSAPYADVVGRTGDPMNGRTLELCFELVVSTGDFELERADVA